ncbi:MAG: hypothetical protein ABIF82_12485, partial [Planctomycetota bacterium]
MCPTKTRICGRGENLDRAQRIVSKSEQIGGVRWNTDGFHGEKALFGGVGHQDADVRLSFMPLV